MSTYWEQIYWATATSIHTLKSFYHLLRYWTSPTINMSVKRTYTFWGRQRATEAWRRFIIGSPTEDKMLMDDDDDDSIFKKEAPWNRDCAIILFPIQVTEATATEVLMTVTRIRLFWDVTSCNLPDSYWTFRGTCSLQRLPWRQRWQHPSKQQ